MRWAGGGGRAARAHGGGAQWARAFGMARWLLALVALLALGGAHARKSPAAAKQHEPQIEEVTSKQLERVLDEKDFVAVYWCKCGAGELARRQRSAPARGRRGRVETRRRRCPSKWVILELMIFGRPEGTPAPLRYFEARPGLCNRAAETIKLDPAGDRRARRRGLKWYRVSLSFVLPLPMLSQGRGAYARRPPPLCRRLYRWNRLSLRAIGIPNIFFCRQVSMLSVCWHVTFACVYFSKSAGGEGVASDARGRHELILERSLITLTDLQWLLVWSGRLVRRPEGAIAPRTHAIRHCQCLQHSHSSCWWIGLNAKGWVDQIIK